MYDRSGDGHCIQIQFNQSLSQIGIEKKVYHTKEKKSKQAELSWAKLSSIGNWALLKLMLGLSLAIKVLYSVDMRFTYLAK